MPHLLCYIKGGDKLQKPTHLYKLNDGVRILWTKEDQSTFLQDTALFSILIPAPRTMPGTHKGYDIFLNEIINHKSWNTSSEKPTLLRSYLECRETSCGESTR